jgi:hypothetical protein
MYIIKENVSPPYQILGAVIREARKSSGFGDKGFTSQRELAPRVKDIHNRFNPLMPISVGTAQTAISGVETGALIQYVFEKPNERGIYLYPRIAAVVKATHLDINDEEGTGFYERFKGVESMRQHILKRRNRTYFNQDLARKIFPSLWSNNSDQVPSDFYENPESYQAMIGIATCEPNDLLNREKGKSNLSELLLNQLRG